ncbi:hypothetical protein [Arachidicoccus terrestris]|uniref:hypothetical protein n=1 Tax=Arachidicoccus terrestris TaxID=2875539 RepID=UPI001CC3CCB6|nr:hypothetical protein [Arachidicoccus terrestris]UAY56231.1 hypothetical protein K9M52_04225 [Arachidicoccus terrestris]
MAKYHLITKNGEFVSASKDVKEQYTFNSITGNLVRITTDQNKYGKILKLHMISESEYWIISMFVNSRAAFAFLMTVPNIWLSDPFTITIGKNTSTGKDHLSIMQGRWSRKWFTNWPSPLPGLAEQKSEYIFDYMVNEIMPALDLLPNPYPYNIWYSPPSRATVYGGYFDPRKSKVRKSQI